MQAGGDLNTDRPPIAPAAALLVRHKLLALQQQLLLMLLHEVLLMLQGRLCARRHLQA
jgi:hypothetical protein